MKINKVKKKGVKLIIVAIIIMFIVSSAIYAVSNINPDPVTNDTVKILSAEEVQELLVGSEWTYDMWEGVMEQSAKKLPREQELELYNQGYDFYDIQVAEDLAGLCEKTPQELLELKGITTYTTEGSSIKDSSKPWSDIITQLKIKMQKPTQALGITDAQINDMKQQGLSDSDIEQVAILSFNYKKDYKEVMKELEEGKGIEELKKQYWQKRQEDSKKQSVTKDKARANTEELLKKQYDITDDDIKMCSEYGMTDMVEIAMAKDISIKNDIELEKVLQIKIDKKNWKDVRDEAGGK